MNARLRRLLDRKFIRDTLTLQAAKIGMVALSLISSVLVWRLMGPALYGVFALAQSFLVIWQSLDFSGIGTSTSTRLAIAIGARDDGAVLDLLAIYVKVSLAINASLALLIVVAGAPVAARLYNGDLRIVGLAAGLAVGSIADGLYGLVPTALQSRRSMRSLALMQVANQFILTVSTLAAVLISPTPEALVAGRLVYSYSTLALAVVVYGRRRAHGVIAYPPLGAVFRRARTVPLRGAWRFGVANAVDKNLSQLFTQLPLQIVGAAAGARAVGYLQLAMNGIGQASVFTSAVLDNMQAVVPQAVGRRDYAGLWRNFTRVLAVMALIAVALYGALAFVAPPLIPPILGARWIPAVLPLAALTLYGAITMVGGNFGPLYRAFNLMRQAILVKLIALVVVLPAGVALLTARLNSEPGIGQFLGAGALVPYGLIGGSAGALGGALLIDALFAVSVTLTALVTLPELRRRAASTPR